MGGIRKSSPWIRLADVPEHKISIPNQLLKYEIWNWAAKNWATCYIFSPEINYVWIFKNNLINWIDEKTTAMKQTTFVDMHM